MAGSLLALTARHAAAVAVATFSQTSSNFSTNYTGVTPPGASTLTGSGIPVAFTFQSLGNGVTSGTPVVGKTYTGLLTYNSSAFTQGEVPFGSFKNPADSLMYTITSTGTNFGDITPGKILLKTTAITSGPFVAGTLLAVPSTLSATLAGSDVTGFGGDQTIVTLTSDIINTTGFTDESYGLSFVTNTALSYTTYGGPFAEYLNTFHATVSGNFGATTTSVPEPGATALLVGCVLSGSLLRFRRRA